VSVRKTRRGKARPSRGKVNVEKSMVFDAGVRYKVSSVQL
jgi:hypothetical protein